jgi:hypothetical protein
VIERERERERERDCINSELLQLGRIGVGSCGTCSFGIFLGGFWKRPSWPW